LAQVRARTPRVRAAAEHEPARTFRVTVSREGERSTGTLVVEEVDHASAPRSVEGATCQDVVTALAIVAALAIDPRASVLPSDSSPPSSALSPSPSPMPMPSASSSSSAEPSASTSLTAPTPPSSPTRTPIPESAPPLAASTPAPTSPTIGRTRAFIGASADFIGVAAPGVAVGPSFVVGLLRERDGIFSPSARIAFARHGGGTVTSSIGSASFTWTLGQLDVCPIRLRIAADLWIAPCAVGEVGALSADASAAEGRSRVRPWVAAGVSGGLEWRLIGPLSLEAKGGVRAPFMREDFFFEPDVTVYTPPALLVSGSLGAAAIFP
jgi:hypothetical protein